MEMPAEPTIITTIRVIVEMFWTLIRISISILWSIYKCLVPPEPKDVSDDIILITGAGHGLGRAMALSFSKLGSTVVCVDINKPKNDETVQMIKKNKGKAYSYECDISNRKAVFELSEKVKKDVGDVTILINNAGVMTCKPLLKQTEEEIRLMNDININGVLWSIQAFLPAMIENNTGHIVSMASMAGMLGCRNIIPYCGTKHAVRGIMEGLRVELRQDPRGINGIKLTTICPSIVNTGLCRRPNVRFNKMVGVVETEEAANMIVDDIRREYFETTLPRILYYVNKVYRFVPFPSALIGNDFLGIGLDPHD